MLKKSVFSIFSKLKDWWIQTTVVVKIVLVIALTCALASITYYFAYPYQNATIAEITTPPATPPYYSNNLYLGAANVTLSASSLNFFVNDYSIRSFQNMFYPLSVNSSNGSAESSNEYLSALWSENGNSYSLYLGFEATSSSSPVWRLAQISTHDPYTGANYWQPTDTATNDLFAYHPIGTAIDIDQVNLVSSTNASLKLSLSTLHLIAFNNVYTPSPSPSFSPYPVVSSTPYPSPSITTLCSLNPPEFTVFPTSTEAYPGQTVQYSVNVTNRDGRVCGPSSFIVGLQVPEHLTHSYVTTNEVILSPGESRTIQVNVSTPLLNPWGQTRTMPLTFSVINNYSNLSSNTHTSFTLLNPTPQTFNLNLRLAGVPNDRASGATTKIKFSIKDQGSFELSEPVTLAHLYNDVYRATFTLGTPLAPNTNYTLRIKGEKHVGIKQCANPINQGPCPDERYLSIPYYAGSSVDLDLINSPLPAGDLHPQDNKVDYQDITKLKVLMGKTQDVLTSDDIKVGDLNYDGNINTYDVFLLLKTMEIRHDE